MIKSPSVSVRIISSLLAIAAVAGMIELTGGGWDINWHIAQRPETFFTPPHIALYSGAFVLLLAVVAALILGKASLPVKIRPPFVMAAAGVVTQFIAGGWDNWWHATFGVDDSFSPPHILLISGMVVATFGIILSISTFRLFTETEKKRSFLWVFQAIGFAAFWFSVWGLFWVFSYPGFYREPLLPELWQRLTVAGLFTFLTPLVALTSVMIVGRRGAATITYLVGVAGVHTISLLMGNLSTESLIFTPVLVLPGIFADILSPRGRRTFARLLILGLILAGFGFLQGDIVNSMTGNPFPEWIVFLPAFVVGSLVGVFSGYLLSSKVNRWAVKLQTTIHNL